MGRNCFRSNFECPAWTREHATMSRMFILAWTGLHRANNEMQIEIIPGLL